MLPTYITIFVCTFVSILAVGVEMRAIAHRQIGLAIVSAAVIAAGQLVALRIVPGSTNWLDYAGYILSNCAGIGASFAMHQLLTKKSQAFEAPLSICEGKSICPFMPAVPCPKESARCPAILVFSEKGRALNQA